eukprot:150489-Chlamydomonas_euryale.AAC.1
MASAAMAEIESATDWRQLPGVYARVARLPANHVHVLAMAQALALLVPGGCHWWTTAVGRWRRGEA